MATKKLYQEIAWLVCVIRRCEKSNNTKWLRRHTARLHYLVQGGLPFEIDCRTNIALESSTPDRLIFDVEFHDTNDSGVYGRWTKHRVFVTPSIAFGFYLRVTGGDRNIKKYLADVYNLALSKDLKPELDDGEESKEYGQGLEGPP